MSLIGLFDISRSALFANQTALYVTSHNIANVNTEGYNRQDVVFETAKAVQTRGGFIGRGVRVVTIRRQYDSFIYNQLLGQNISTGRYRSIKDALVQIEQIFNEARDTGLLDRLNEFASAWQEVATNAESIPHRTVLLKKASTLLMTARSMERRLLDTLKNIDASVDDVVEKINTLASEIARLNQKIVQIEAGGGMDKANDLRDQRERVLLELAELVDITYYENDDGSITVITGMRNLVDRDRAKKLSVMVNPDGSRKVLIDRMDITGFIKGGRLAGLLDVRDDIVNEPLYRLRRLIASIIKEVNTIHRQGYDLDGNTGRNFFAPLQLYTEDYSSGADITATIVDMDQLTLDEYSITFDGTNYYVYRKQTGDLVSSGVYVSGAPVVFEGIEVVITGTPASGDSFVVSPLTGVIRDATVQVSDPRGVAAASSDSTLPADNTNALEIVALFESTVGSLQDSSFFDYYNATVSSVGAKSRFASDALKFEENLLQEMETRRESVSGVSLEEEAINLIRYQRAFEASARMIKVADEILQSILNL